MARPREFETDAALEGAMSVFWQHGYDGASLPDLLTGMGITRGSFYKAFGDKKSLFLLILERYEGAVVEPAVALLTDPSLAPGLRAERFFRGVVARVEAGDRRGCLMCSAADGPASEDADVAKAVATLLDRMRDGFRAITRDDARAEALLMYYVGLRVTARSGAPVAAMARSVDGVLALQVAA